MSDNACRECETLIDKDYKWQFAATNVQPNRTRIEGTVTSQPQEVLGGMSTTSLLPESGAFVVTLLANLTALPDIRIRIRKPIPVILALEGNDWIADQKDFNLCATGETPEDAQLSLAEYLCEDFDHWQRLRPEKLSKDAENLLGKYREYLVLAIE